MALNIWGITGKEGVWSVFHPYFKGAHGVVLSYDITSEWSFTNMRTITGRSNECFPS